MKSEYKRQDVEVFILKALQKNGGTATRQTIKEEIVADSDNNITYENVFEPITSKKGNSYVPFNFDFNFGLLNLLTCGYIQSYSRGSDIILTEKGRKIKPKQFPSDIDKKMIDEYWEQKHKDLKIKKEAAGAAKKEPEISEEANTEDNAIDEEDVTEKWKIEILEQIKHFSPKKFETFSRLLLSQMGIKFDGKKGIKMSGDHGIDGYGYFESDEFRTAKVVVQCKKYTDAAVSEPDIDKFKGVMMSFSADYGIFITTSYFTKQAQEKAVQGGNTVTLIDGQRLVELIEKYKLHITPVQTYEIDDYYYQKD